MTYEVEVLADSISPAGVRITTIKAVYPRFLHAEMLRHRAFGHSVASSRAIPPEKLIERVQHDPFVPDFNKRVRGMGVGEPLNERDAKLAREAWINASYKAAQAALVLVGLDVDKSRINRLLEPFLWLTDIITATEWSNFLALRQPSNDDQVPQQFPAQPEFQIIARMIREALRKSKPLHLSYGDWHLPLVMPDEIAEHDGRLLAEVSAGRCARASFDKQDEHESIEDSRARFARLAGGAHWSPMEHTARPLDGVDDLEDSDLLHRISAPPVVGCETDGLFCGHLRGWVCLRKLYPDEHDRAIAIAERPEVEVL